jgi:hypothetical protein
VNLSAQNEGLLRIGKRGRGVVRIDQAPILHGRTIVVERVLFLEDFTVGNVKPLAFAAV